MYREKDSIRYGPIVKTCGGFCYKEIQFATRQCRNEQIFVLTGDVNLLSVVTGG